MLKKKKDGGGKINKNDKIQKIKSKISLLSEEEFKKFINYIDNNNSSSKFKKNINKILFNVDYYYHRIKQNYYCFIRGIKNFWKFRKVIWNYGWWNFEYLLDIVEVVLKDWEKHYGTDSIYIGDMLEKIRARELLYLLEKWREAYNDWEFEKAEYYKNLFFDKFGKYIQYFWD